MNSLEQTGDLISEGHFSSGEHQEQDSKRELANKCEVCDEKSRSVRLSEEINRGKIVRPRII